MILLPSDLRRLQEGCPRRGGVVQTVQNTLDDIFSRAGRGADMKRQYETSVRRFRVLGSDDSVGCLI